MEIVYDRQCDDQTNENLRQSQISIGVYTHGKREEARLILVSGKFWCNILTIL